MKKVTIRIRMQFDIYGEDNEVKPLSEATIKAINELLYAAMPDAVPVLYSDSMEIIETEDYED